MLDTKKLSLLIVLVFGVVVFIFWVICHLPIKKNKDKKRDDMRIWTTVLSSVVLVFTFTGVKQDYTRAIAAPLCLIFFDIVVSKMIEIIE